MNPTFSILISCYKLDIPSDLNLSLESILNQTVLPHQVVIVCDGPLPENLYQIILKFEKKAINMNIVINIIKLEKNYGLGLALRNGAEYCSGSHIVRMDSDDICNANRLFSLQREIISNPDIDVLGSQIEEFENHIGDLNRYRKVPLSHYEIEKRAKYMSPMNHVTVCIRNETLKSLGSYEHMLWHEDYFLWLKLLGGGANFKNMNESHVYVRVSGLSNRRKGFKYFKAEIAFVSEALKRNYFSIFNAIQFIVPRILIRFAPDFFVNRMYSFIRSKNEKK